MNKSLTPNDGSFLGLLRKWLEGDFRKADDADLRQLLAKDDFQKEAFEGYEIMADGDESESISAMRKRLKTRYQSPSKTIPMRRNWLAAAASLAFFVVAGMWAINHFSSSKMDEKSVAQNAAEPTQPIDNQAVTTPSDAILREQKDEESSGQKDAPSASQPILSDQKTVEFSGKAAVKVPSSDLVFDEKLEEKVFAAESEKPAASAKKESANQPVKDSQISDDLSRSRPDFQSNAGFVYYGKVTDAVSGGPIIGAKVALPGLQFGTSTDLDGDFQVAASTPSGTDVVVSADGYLPKKAKIEGKNVQNIALEADRDRLAEVVVAPAPKAKKRKDAREITDGPTPKMGWSGFETFAKTNLQIPAQAKAKGIKGEVVLEFFVDSKGQPTQIFVLQSLGFGCDEAAIRLLEASGEWSGHQKEAAISIRFDY